MIALSGDLDLFLENNGTQRIDAIWTNHEAALQWIKELRGTIPNSDTKVLDWTVKMLQYDPEERPTAGLLRADIIDLKAQDAYICHFCSLPTALQPSCSTPTLNTVEPSSETTEQGDTTHSHQTTDEAPPVTASALGLPERPSLKLQTRPSSCDSPKNTKDSQAITPQAKVEAIGSEVIPTVLVLEPPSKGLPENRRPEPSLIQEEGAVQYEATVQDGEFIRPEPILPPQFLQKDSLPRATLAPSYVLAGTNRFSKAELESQNGVLGKNLFVYGRLMFPSTLRAIAAQSTRGVYSRDLKRRLFPSSEDWSKADTSIRRASQIMTPARLEGYDRWKPSGLNCAVVQASCLSKRIMKERWHNGYSALPCVPPGFVNGFLIRDVRSEALRYCDLLFGSDRRIMKSMRPREDTEGDEDKDIDDSYLAHHLLQRESVTVQVEAISGELMTVAAETYVWSYGIDNLTNIWEEERFLRSSPMQTILRDQPTWAAEEQALANIMGISFAQAGDALCAPIMAGNYEGLAALLNNRFDANCSCRVYGYPLTAAVSQGHEDMVKLLLDHHANVNAVGGQYGTALIAAAFSSRKTITKMLLRRGADIFKEDDVHVNALYQAVAHADYSVTEMLLEHGAWLSMHWGEIMDLSEELGDREIQNLLDRYDVRKIHRQHKLLGYRREDESDDSSDGEGKLGDGELLKGAHGGGPEGCVRSEDVGELARSSRSCSDGCSAGCWRTTQAHRLVARCCVPRSRPSSTC